MTFDNDFRQAIADLPSKEKDKLILRLLKKDVSLANRLYFELLETKSVEDVRNELMHKIESIAIKVNDRYYTPGILLL